MTPITFVDRTIEADHIVARKSIRLITSEADGVQYGLCIESYSYGTKIELTDQDPAKNRIEFFVGNGTGNTAPVLTLSAAPGKNFVELRLPGDRGCLNITLPETGPITIQATQDPAGDGSRVPVDLVVQPHGSLQTAKYDWPVQP